MNSPNLREARGFYHVIMDLSHFSEGLVFDHVVAARNSKEVLQESIEWLWFATRRGTIT